MYFWIEIILAQVIHLSCLLAWYLLNAHLFMSRYLDQEIENGNIQDKMPVTACLKPFKFQVYF